MPDQHMIEWAVAHRSHAQRFFKGLYPDAPITYGPSLWTKEHSLLGPTEEDAPRACVTLTPDSEVWVVVEGRLLLRVCPSEVDPLRFGRYTVRGPQEKEERWRTYIGKNFADVVTEELARTREGLYC